MLDEGFNQLKLWPEVRRRMKFQPDETLVGGEVWQHEAMRARMCVDAQVCHCGFFACRNRGKPLVNLKKQNGPIQSFHLLYAGRFLRSSRSCVPVISTPSLSEF